MRCALQCLNVSFRDEASTHFRMITAQYQNKPLIQTLSKLCYAIKKAIILIF